MTTATSQAHEERPDVLPIQHVQLTKAEQDSGQLSPENRKLAGFILTCRGYVVFKDAFRPDYIERIGREVSEIYEDCRATMGTVPTSTSPIAVHQVHESNVKRASFWYRESRWRIFPKLVAPMSDPEIMANAFTTPIIEDLLGPDFYCKYLSSDTCVKGAILQSPHSDIDGHGVFVNNVWKPRGLIVNIPTMLCGLHNGPIEVWPGGSHMFTAEIMKRYGISPDVQDGRNPPVERLAEYLPSVKLTLRPGEIMIRDLHMWHRGTPNPTDKPRTMLTIGYFRGDHNYGYGDPSYNLDRSMFDNLSPRVKRMFEYHFSLKSTIRREQQKLRSAAKKAAKDFVKAGISKITGS